jgi:hypothetical protein
MASSNPHPAQFVTRVRLITISFPPHECPGLGFESERGDSSGSRRAASIAAAGEEALPGTAEFRAEGDQKPPEG